MWQGDELCVSVPPGARGGNPSRRDPSKFASKTEIRVGASGDEFVNLKGGSIRICLL
jgi:hypothetical protein